MVSEETSIKTLASDLSEYMGNIPAKYERLRDLPYLKEVSDTLVAKAKEVYLPSKGDPYIFRYFMMLCVQSITAFSGKDGVPNHVYAYLFFKLDDFLSNHEPDVDHNKFVIDDLSNALIHARSDAKLLREDLLLAREEIRLLRNLNHAMMWGNSDTDLGESLAP